jgi:aminopeptidase N
MAAGFDYPLANLKDDYASYELADAKGYVVYDMLSRLVGRAQFQKALRRVTSQYADRGITLGEFLGEIARNAPTDIRWFYRQWFERPGAPVISLHWAAKGPGHVYVTLVQTTPPYRLDVPLQIELADGSAVSRVVSLAAETLSVRLAVPRQVHTVRLDPHMELFRFTPEQQAEAKALRYWTAGNLAWNHGRSDEARAAFADGLRHLPKPDAYGTEFLLHMYLGWMEEEADSLTAARSNYEMAANASTRVPEQLARLYVNLGRTAERMGDTTRAVEAARKAINADAVAGPSGRTREAIALLNRLTKH